MKLTVVGCSGSAPGPASAASCYLVEHQDFRLLLDLGSGAFGALQTLLDPGEVDAIFLSHLHADHCLDVAPFVVWHRYAGRTRGRRVPLLAPAGAARRLAAAYDPTGDRVPGALDDVFDVAVVTPGEFAIGPFGARTARTRHPVECHALRLTAGRCSLVYTGDTAASDQVVELARGVDLLLAEASHPDVPDLPAGLHLTGREAGEHAAAAGVGRLLLTHVPPWVDAVAQLAYASAVFPETELVRPGGVYYV